MVSDDTLAERHKPIIFLHPWERYFPMDLVDWWGKTEGFTDGDRSHRRVKTGFEASTIASYAKDVEVYWQATHADGKIISLSYFIFFGYNGSKRIAGIYPTGAHEADMEQFMVSFTDDGDVAFYGLSVHGKMHIYNVKKGFDLGTRLYDMQYTADELATQNLQLDGTRPIIYPANNSHALYGAPGMYLRFGGFGNDSTGKGRRVDPKLISYMSSSKELTQIRKYRGTLGVASVADYSTRIKTFKIGQRSLMLPDLFAKAIPHFKRVPRWLGWFTYLGYVVSPIVVAVFLRDKRPWLPFVAALALFYIQLLFIKAVLHLVGDSLGISADKDPVWKFVFPLWHH